MTKEQIQKYNYCRNHLARIEGFIKEVTHGIQLYGCGSGQPNIEHDLDKLHRKMHEDVLQVYEGAKKDVHAIIKSI